MREPWSYCFPQLSLLCRPALFLKLYMAKTKIITRETSGTHDILVTGWVAELSHSDTSFSSVITFKWSESLSSQSHSGAGGTGWWGAQRPITPGQQVGTSGTSGVSRDINGDCLTPIRVHVCWYFQIISAFSQCREGMCGCQVGKFM